MSSQAGLCLRKRGIVDLRKRGANAVHQQGACGGERRLTAGAVAHAQWPPRTEMVAVASSFRSMPQCSQVTGPGGVWKMRCTALKVHASASTHVLQFLGHGRGWGGHM